MPTNGQYPQSQIVTLDGAPFYMNTANAYRQAQHAAAGDKVTLRIINSYSAYRSLALQSAMRADPGSYKVGKVNGRYIQQLPVGKSTHGGGEWNGSECGFAIDVIEGHAWLLEHGSKFGFTRTNPTGDPNHFHHDNVTAIHLPTSTAGVGTITPVPKPTTTPKGNTMKNWSIIVERNIGAGATSTTLPKAKNLGIFLVGDGAITEINTQAMNELAPILAGARGDVSTGTFGYIKAHLAAIQK